MWAYARKTIALGEDARRQSAGRELVGRVRLGIVEDLAITRLPSIVGRLPPPQSVGRNRSDIGERTELCAPSSTAGATSSWPIRPVLPKRPKAHLSRQRLGLVRKPDAGARPTKRTALDHVRRLVLLAGPHAGIAGRGRRRMADRGACLYLRSADCRVACRPGRYRAAPRGRRACRLRECARQLWLPSAPTADFGVFSPITLPCWWQSWPCSSRPVSNSRVFGLD